MNTNQTNDNAGNTIDFRKDTPPTDRLMECVKERYGHLPPADIKTEYEFVEEFICELGELRCKPGCVNGDGDSTTSVSANGQAKNSQSTNGQLAVNCICSLLGEMTRAKSPLVPKGEFVAVVEAAGYSQEDALAHYRNYAWVKLNDEHEEEILRLLAERGNAHNWWLELGSWEASAQASAAGNELRALDLKIDQKLEAIMSA